MFWTFILGLVVDILVFLWLGDCLGYFLKNRGIFFISSGVNVIELISFITNDEA
jgi:hypothetical protein